MRNTPCWLPAFYQIREALGVFLQPERPAKGQNLLAAFLRVFAKTVTTYFVRLSCLL